MIADVMVHLSGSAADDTRLAAADAIADFFSSQVVGLFINELPLLLPEEGGGVGTVELINRAREAGDEIEQRLAARLSRLERPWELRRHDVVGEAAAAAEACREARAADTFVALRPNGVPQEPDGLAEAVIFGSGRHVLLVPEGAVVRTFRRVIVGWNDSREAARSLAEGLPYLKRAEQVFVVVIVENSYAESQVELGANAVRHLAHHGIEAKLHPVENREKDVGATLLAEAEQLKADLIVLGGYGHSRLREWLLGGVTYKLLHEARVPLLIAH